MQIVIVLHRLAVPALALLGTHNELTKCNRPRAKSSPFRSLWIQRIRAADDVECSRYRQNLRT